jgi:FixJ family two-component response regulator
MQKVVGIVEDDPAMLSSVDRLLQSTGYVTELFSSGEAALEAVATSAAGCFVIDIHLGGISGIEVGRELAARGSSVPIIFMSGAANGLAERAAAEVGCIAFLRKPFPADALLEAIERAFRPPTALPSSP